MVQSLVRHLAPKNNLLLMLLRNQETVMTVHQVKRDMKVEGASGKRKESSGGPEGDTKMVRD